MSSISWTSSSSVALNFARRSATFSGTTGVVCDGNLYIAFMAAMRSAKGFSMMAVSLSVRRLLCFAVRRMLLTAPGINCALGIYRILSSRIIVEVNVLARVGVDLYHAQAVAQRFQLALGAAAVAPCNLDAFTLLLVFRLGFLSFQFTPPCSRVLLRQHFFSCCVGVLASRCGCKTQNLGLLHCVGSTELCKFP